MDILCLGTLTVDIFIQKGELLQIGSTNSATELEAAEVHPGGTAINTSLDLAKLGLPVGVITRVGNDAGGQLVIQRLREGGVHLTTVRRDPDVNTTMTIYVSERSGELSYFYYPGTSATFNEADVDFDQIKRSKFLHVGGTFMMPNLDGEPTARILNRAQQTGLVTSLDPTPYLTSESQKIISTCLPFIDYFLPNLEQAEAISGQNELSMMADFFLERGVRVVGIKMGHDGCYLKTKDEAIRLPAFKVQEVEVTGAGDAFVAGIITGAWNGWELEQTGRFANAVGAMSVRGVGAQAGIGTTEETLEFMAQTEVNDFYKE